MTVVLDASALLALVQNEPGGSEVMQILPQSLMSAVNWSEVAQKTAARDMDPAQLRARLEGAGLEIVPFNARRAEQAAALWGVASNLSLADRACLALGAELGADVWTTDRAWAAVQAGAVVRVIR